VKKTEVGPLINNSDLKLPNGRYSKQLKINSFFILQPSFKSNISIASVMSHPSAFRFLQNYTFIYLYGIDKITTSRTTDKCQLLLKSCYSVGYNYQICHCIFRLAAININNVVNYCSNIHDISFQASNLCWLAGGGI